MTQQPADDEQLLDPEALLRAVLHISKEVAAEVLEQADVKADRKD